MISAVEQAYLLMEFIPPLCWWFGRSCKHVLFVWLDIWMGSSVLQDFLQDKLKRTAFDMEETVDSHNRIAQIASQSDPLTIQPSVVRAQRNAVKTDGRVLVMNAPHGTFNDREETKWVFFDNETLKMKARAPVKISISLQGQHGTFFSINDLQRLLKDRRIENDEMLHAALQLTTLKFISGYSTPKLSDAQSWSSLLVEKCHDAIFTWLSHRTGYILEKRSEWTTSW